MARDQRRPARSGARGPPPRRDGPRVDCNGDPAPPAGPLTLPAGCTARVPTPRSIVRNVAPATELEVTTGDVSTEAPAGSARAKARRSSRMGLLGGLLVPFFETLPGGPAQPAPRPLRPPGEDLRAGAHHQARLPAGAGVLGPQCRLQLPGARTRGRDRLAPWPRAVVEPELGARDASRSEHPISEISPSD